MDHNYHQKKDANFIIRTTQSQKDLSTRTYGFLKASRTDTPIPKSHKTLHTSTLIERLHSVHDRIDLQTESEQNDLSSSVSTDLWDSNDVPVEKSPFELKRKLFDSAEFTIAQGVKLSTMLCPINPSQHTTVHRKDPGAFSLDEMESYCRRLNIQFDR
ncbi:uncharacterized protein LOC108110551 [Drosophila eugracilis]|uniref:uncharacterized protein LOC108110551 n=1 Tax=Drosophila eugracilis TaxID=29029 RepID=UPI0007E6028E|nr:uncharacterized protein LOC108110551 [Drosophila eugracilis]